MGRICTSQEVMLKAASPRKRLSELGISATLVDDGETTKGAAAAGRLAG